MSRLHREAMNVLIGEITSGALAEGDQLPREVDLVEQFAISRGVVRECIRGLEERGLIRVKHGRGATVTPEGDWDVFDPDVLAALLRGERAGDVLAEYLESRRLLEVGAAELAARRATDATVTALSDAFTAMVSAAERARDNPAAESLYQEADIAFHRAVVAASGNRALGRMTEPIHRALATTFPSLARPEHRFERSLPEHDRIRAAIADADPAEARDAMAAHLDTVDEYLREYTAGRASRRRRRTTTAAARR
jgi:GntR family transcriptional repressor for pyruvate dehydrogenase complex